jgi:hypothetical protein
MPQTNEKQRQPALRQPSSTELQGALQHHVLDPADQLGQPDRDQGMQRQLNDSQQKAPVGMEHGLIHEHQDSSLASSSQGAPQPLVQVQMQGLPQQQVDQVQQDKSQGPVVINDETIVAKVLFFGSQLCVWE